MTDQLAQKQRPQRVQLFVTCLVDQFKPEVGESVVNVLERLGIRVDFPEGQTCCGQPAFNSGFRNDAAQVARHFLDVFDATEGPIVVPSGSCGAMVRNYYGDMFEDDPAEMERAKRVGERIYEFTEFLVDVLGEDISALGLELDDTATYHQCCHLERELGVDHQPRELLEQVKGLEMLPMYRSEVCCGFGGTFSVKFSDVSTAMLDEKLDNAAATRASTIVAGDTGCIMHMAGGLHRRGSEQQVRHIAEVLDDAATGSTD
ncbi:MAG: (Fe-S)-binding protein [Chloroflexi bacterium]|jgi:L-lactate dehydrogenase complex protein LldE|nr:(Fe-S)-binding protein [Chloroflexota bacterium]MBT4072488.1 (Fe-S)-binding protein [Chloroflexota bacterium]MBT4513952.1 (Fe-S)-binding protein [Chloroflexota bacterium]MBT6681652.1 (Fe-S)-binding protein [Chloroflexota bacterium]